MFSPNIFKAYDIRGLVEGELSVDLAYAVGRAFAVFLRTRGGDFSRKKAVVGRDMRATSHPFQQAVMRALNDEGVSVADIGLTTTPLFNFACAHYEEHLGGIMVTASHNPGQYNGFKMTLADGLPIGKNNGMDEIKNLVLSGNFKDAPKKGTIETKAVLSDYLTRLFAVVSPINIRPLKIVVDAGNSMAKITIPEVIKKTSLAAEYLYLEPDGNFPNHEANPLKIETLKDLQERVKATGADFGFALDGDCDRIGLVDERGEVVAPSFAGALMGLEVLKKYAGGLMLYDLRSSQIVPEAWKGAGARAEKCVVGHALIKKMMKETGAIFASELSGHLYFKDMYDVESSDLVLLYVAQMLSRENKKLSELVAPMMKYWHSGEINFKTENGAAIMEKAEEAYAPTATEVSHLDGLRMDFSWGWFSIRISNTEPVLRLNLEADAKENMEAKVAELKKIITE